MNIQDFQATLPILTKNSIVPFVWGYQGIGKTQSVGQVAKKLGLGFVHLHLATQEVGDLVGLLVHTGEGTVTHARPEWFPTEGAGIIFLDELNRAHPDVIQAMFSFITSKTIHRHKLPEGWVIVAAGNYSNDSFNVTDTSDAAWMSRFCHIHLQPSVAEFTVFAQSKGHDSVAEFISEHNSCLEVKFETPDLAIRPDRRSWIDMIGPLEQEQLSDEIRHELYEGIVGLTAASTFMSHKKVATKAILLKDVLADYSKVRARVLSAVSKEGTRFDLLSTPLDELVAQLRVTPDLLTSDSVVNLREFFLDLPLEMLAGVCGQLGGVQFNFKNAILNDPEFIEKLMKKAA